MISKNNSLIQIICLNENIGVAAGRNLGASKSDADIIVFIDDDAVFKNTNALITIADYFKRDEKIGALAFKIMNFYKKKSLSNFGYSRLMQSFAFKDIDFLCPNFIGCGNAVKKKTFDLLGGFEEKYFYWGEEAEFSIRLYSFTEQYIIYTNSIVVFHKTAEISRNRNKFQLIEFKIKHRLDMVSRYYFPYYRKNFFVAFWMARYIIEAFKKGCYREILVFTFNKKNFIDKFKIKNENNKFKRYALIRRISFMPFINKKLKYMINNNVL